MFNGCQIYEHIISETQADPIKLRLRLLLLVVFASLLTRIIKVKKLDRSFKLKKIYIYIKLELKSTNL